MGQCAVPGVEEVALTAALELLLPADRDAGAGLLLPAANEREVDGPDLRRRAFHDVKAADVERCLADRNEPLPADFCEPDRTNDRRLERRHPRAVDRERERVRVFHGIR